MPIKIIYILFSNVNVMILNTWRIKVDLHTQLIIRSSKVFNFRNNENVRLTGISMGCSQTTLMCPAGAKIKRNDRNTNQNSSVFML